MRASGDQAGLGRLIDRSEGPQLRGLEFGLAAVDRIELHGGIVDVKPYRRATSLDDHGDLLVRLTERRPMQAFDFALAQPNVGANQAVLAAHLQITAHELARVKV